MAPDDAIFSFYSVTDTVATEDGNVEGEVCVRQETRLMFGEVSCVSLMAGLHGVDLSQMLTVTKVTLLAG